MPLTGGRWRPPTVTLNKSPAWVLSGNESTTVDSFPLLLIDFLRPSFMSLDMTLFCNDFERDAGDSLATLPMSEFGDNPTWFSGFCIVEFKACLVYWIIREEPIYEWYIFVKITDATRKRFQGVNHVKVSFETKNEDSRTSTIVMEPPLTNSQNNMMQKNFWSHTTC